MLKYLRGIRLSVVFLAVIILLIFLHYSGILRPIQNLAIIILSPVQHRVYSIGAGINNFYSNFSTRKDLVEFNKQLTENLNQLTIANAQLKTILEENEQLLAEKNFLESNNLQAITAKVIGKNPRPNLQAIILNKGSKDGVNVGLPLITSGGIIVGKITEVRSNYSEAVLINDSRSRLAAMVQNETGSRGVVVGEHGLSLKMELIPQDEIAIADQVVVTSGLEPAIPRGLVIGKISRVADEENSAFQTAWLQPLIRIDNLLVVSILKNFSYE